MTLPGLVVALVEWLRIARLGLVVALVAGVAAPVALLADLYQPGRFWCFYAHPNLHSWMAWGAFFIPGYLGGLMLYAGAALRPALRSALFRAAAPHPLLGCAWRLLALGGAPAPLLLRLGALAATVFALLALLYTGMEVMGVRARPLWNTPLLPVQFAITAQAGAVGAVLVLDRVLRGHEPALAEKLTRMLAWLISAELVLGLMQRTPAHAAALAAVAHSETWRMTGTWASTAALATAALALQPRLGWLAGLPALHAAWMFRWSVSIGGQTSPSCGVA